MRTWLTRGGHVSSARIFALFLLFRVDFCISKIPLNMFEYLKLTKEKLAANGLLERTNKIVM
jgi:hypothetical protein